MSPKPTVRTPETLRAAMAVTCPACGAIAAARCRKGASSRPPHAARIEAAKQGRLAGLAVIAGAAVCTCPGVARAHVQGVGGCRG